MYFGDMKRINRDRPTVLGGLPTPERVGASDVASLDPSGVAILDTRPWDAFANGHLPGSLSFPLGSSFCTDVGSMVGVDERICLIVEEATLKSTLRQLVRIGCDAVERWCPASELAGNGLASASIEECDVSSILSGAGEGEAILDVRRLTEFDAGHMPGASNISHTRLRGRTGEVPDAARLYVSCRSGKRSARSCAFLARAGREVVNVRGGWLTWEAAGGAAER